MAFDRWESGIPQCERLRGRPQALLAQSVVEHLLESQMSRRPTHSNRLLLLLPKEISQPIASDPQQPTPEPPVRSLLIEPLDRLIHRAKHILSHVRCIARLQPALPSPSVNQRPIEVSQSFPSRRLTPLCLIDQSYGR